MILVPVQKVSGRFARLYTLSAQCATHNIACPVHMHLSAKDAYTENNDNTGKFSVCVSCIHGFKLKHYVLIEFCLQAKFYKYRNTEELPSLRYIT